jgi:hypothetical protein
MDYTAVNAKVRAMTTGDVKRILPWLPDKPRRELLSLMVPESIHGRGIHEYLPLWRRLHQCDKENRRALLPLIGMEIDLRNIVWMYRLKKYYGVSGVATYGKLIPIRHRLTEGQTRLMAEAGDPRQLLSVVSQGPYAGFFPSFNKPEKYLCLGLEARYKRQARLHPRSLAPVCAYLYAWQMKALGVAAW